MPVKTVLNSWAVETKPWERIHIDYAGPLNGKMYLVVVDAYSKWPEVSVMLSSSTAATLKELRMFVSDNGQQFTVTGSSSSAQSRGLSTFAHRLSIHGGTDNGEASRILQCYRRTLGMSVPGSLSPAEMFLGRQMTSLTLLKEPTKETGTRNEKMEKLFNRHHGAQEKSYKMGESV
ncbi:hypothetical protein OESDEN_14640 [Oesophagostomum dentatum]|uniref:Integrase catalytic domain-containing protein n=1 Tax=Oesophagostomum dentatum TaxID=61180 RepID=A0A0B1SR47_OESDE|nr:hypothetical protein OESDEN_14640 [Oesophagostomum dentatum]